MTKTLKSLIANAETGEQWAEICRIEDQMVRRVAALRMELGTGFNEVTNQYLTEDEFDAKTEELRDLVAEVA